MMLDGDDVVLPVALLTPTGMRIIGHFTLPSSETIDPATGHVMQGIAPDATPKLMRQLLHLEPEDSGTYHRPSPEGYTFVRE